MKIKLWSCFLSAMLALFILQPKGFAQINKQVQMKQLKVTTIKGQFLNKRIQPQSAMASQNRQVILNSLKFNGKNGKAVSGLFIKSSELKTVRNGRTTEVVANDGNLNMSESVDSESTVQEDGFICDVQQVTLTAGFNELNLMDPSAAEIWPGRIINIASMDEGAYQSFTDFTSRKNLKLALIAAGTSQSSVVDSVAGNAVTQGMVTNTVGRLKNSFGTNSFGSQGWMFEDIQYSNMEQFSIEAGLGVSAVPINLDISASASTRNGSKKNKIIIKFLRDAFTVKVDNDLNDVVVANNLSPYAGIIATVSYGSFGIVEVESDSSYSDIKATLNAAFQADPTTRIDANMTLAQKGTLSNMSIKGIFKGIDGNQSLRENMTLDGVRRILTNDVANFTAVTPVVPIAFGIKSLKTGETMMLRTTLSYPRRNCVPVPAGSPDMKVRVKMIAFTCPQVNDGISNDEDVFGSITVSNGTVKNTVWEKDITRNVKVKNSVIPADDGAYSLNGRATDFVFTMKTDPASLAAKEISVKVALYDEEFEKGRPYEFRTIRIKHKDIYKVIKNPAEDSGSVDYDKGNRMFKIVTNEAGNTNKIVSWFKILED